jgi:hypothetical protein
LAKEGKIIFSFDGRVSIDFVTLIGCLSKIARPFAILIDDAADRAALIRSIFEADEIKVPFLILAADRDYRQDHIDRLVADLDVHYFSIQRWDTGQFEQLIEKYRKLGLVGSSDALNHPKQFALKLKNDPIAIAACRVLNDFRPIAEIVASIWEDARESERESFLIAALAYHCHPSGLAHHILHRANQNAQLNDQFDYFCPLPLTYVNTDESFVAPLSAVMGERILDYVSQSNTELMLGCFVKLSSAIAPYVNRRSSIARTPESLIAGRLFNAEKVIRPLLGLRATHFYDLTQSDWQWNSRYWEQRALLAANTDLELGIRYARHAVAIEQHPFPWTTLASILARKMNSSSNAQNTLFSEIYELISKTLHYEAGRMWRSSPHPYWTLVSSTQKHIEGGGHLSRSQSDYITLNVDRALTLFGRNAQFEASAKNLQILLRGP